jgi:hypothetical protein
MAVAAKKDDVSAPHVFHRGLPNQCDILRPDPWKHTGALNAERDAAAMLQGVRDSRGVARAAFAAYPLRLFAPIGSRLHPFLKSKRLSCGSSNSAGPVKVGASASIQDILSGRG